MLNMLGIRLEPELEARLAKLAAKTGRTKTYYAKKAIRAYLEDQEDYQLAVAALPVLDPRSPGEIMDDLNAP